MADQDIFHTAELVKAAIPFVDNRTQGMADLFVKVCDLMGSVKSAKKPQNLAACGFTLESIDIEGLLAAVRPVCNKRERDIVDRILNLFHMKKMFEMYTSMMETMKNMQDLGGFSFGDMNTEDTSNIFSSFSGTNFESIFQTIKAFTSQGTNDNEDSTASDQFTSDNINRADTKNVYAAEVDAGNNTDTDQVFDSDASNNYGSYTNYGYQATSDSGYETAVGGDNSDTGKNDNSADKEAFAPKMDQSVADILRDIKSAAAADSISNYSKNFGSNFSSGSGTGSGSGAGSGSGSASGSGIGSGSGSVIGSGPGTGSGSGSGSTSGSTSGTASGSGTGSNTGSGSSPTPMLDMLKTMVPSDKINTFENLSMLFNSMSYDNNDKTDDQKGE